MASMGNYPYRSAYFTGNPDFPYPAWPARVVCSQLAGSFQGDEELLAAGGAAISVIFNVTQSVPCYDYAFAQSSTSLGAPGSYSYQTCTQFQLNSIWFGTNGAPRDMFWRAATPFNRSALDASCVAAFGGVVLPHIGEMHLRYGLFPDQFAAAATNVVFSNGLLDPWGSAGYLEGLAPSLPAVVLPQGAHHVDLMFADPADPPQFAEARDEIMGHVRTWIDDWVEQQEETEQE
ncbi:hypothetical protein CHLNCDRAFT_144218 [Chlorella variabilis]|uniref:Lysosomal Pro-X carboxypeptidase n=1 Tax=Chlorella variabilis TaxID=554065 RepID=E1ZC67_CHLVA|nr:hypothetical protein CHLNCDRAFT_144218 [Chlorella variabilis]EFN56756.1 hypothetical protein CHLNCDRAFT_144218 [Chlorella variabilis]|eukprot:XP_005848858.1 hypothetical protein CHLNCDRAFT_144218 [Chlorella variabilis]